MIEEFNTLLEKKYWNITDFNEEVKADFFRDLESYWFSELESEEIYDYFIKK